jgi:succinate-semialdehyde dehydrogenase/glutarate-semialdehyde dehydrogenase
MSSTATTEIPNWAPTKMLIGGSWVDARSGHVFEVEDPATQQVLTEVPDASGEDALAAVEAASTAQASWAGTPPRERGEILRRAYELTLSRSEDLARLITLENGKPIGEARAEVAYAAEFFRWFSEEAVRIEGRWTVAPNGSSRLLVMHQPVGVSALITPWNFPAAMATRKIAPAAAAGCAMVLKPAEETPLTALAVAALLEEAGLPAGVLNVVTTTRPAETTAPMLRHPAIRKMSFTGSTEVGKILLKSASDQVLRTSMELGGNAPFLVFSDADLESAVEGAMVAKMRNVGEACTSANRFYVANSLAAGFAERLAERMSSLKIGNGLEEDVKVGPLINEAGRSKVSGLVEDMVKQGSRVITGGERVAGQGYFYEPTVVLDVPDGARAMREEIFGPVAPICTFEDESQAIEWANRTEFGLVAYLYTRDLGRAIRVSEALEAGMIGLNAGIVSNPAAPFGGVKQSGIGREGGREGIHEFLETKYVAVNW